MGPLLGWLNENAAAFGVLVAAVYTVFALLLWRVTYRQAAVMRQMFETSQRPYLSVAPITGLIARGRLPIRFVFSNHGTIPATLTRWQVTIRSTPDKVFAEQQRSGPLLIFPNQKEEFEPVEITCAEEVEYVYGATTPTYGEARVEYRGLPGTEYATLVRFKFHQGTFSVEQHESI